MNKDFQAVVMDFVVGHGGQWPTDAQAQADVHALFGKWIFGNLGELGDAVFAALEDGGLSQSDLARLLGTALSQSKPGPPFDDAAFAALIERLATEGVLTTTDLAKALATWVASRTADATLKELIKAASDGRLTRKEVVAAILGWLKRAGQPNLAQAIDGHLTSGNPVESEVIVTLVAAYQIRVGAIQPGSKTIDEHVSRLKDSLAGASDNPLVAVLQALVEGDKTRFVLLALKAFGVMADEGLIEQLLSGQYEAAVKEQLTVVLLRSAKGITKAQAEGLTTALVALFKGELLINPQTEREQLQMTPSQYRLWEEVRQMIYAARLAVQGGALVSTNPQAQPHVFAAAGIGFQDKLVDLVKVDQLTMFIALIELFAATAFGRRKGGQKYLTFGPVNVPLAKSGASCGFVFNDIFDNLDQGGGL